MAGTGFEHPHETPTNSSHSDQSGAESGALSAENHPTDPNLTLIISAWPRLPEPIKAGIIAMIQAAR